MAKTVLTPSRLRRRWASADAEERRELIIDAALALLERHGPGSVTVRRIASRLGVGAMTLYTYLPGQEALRLEMIRRGFRMIHSQCQAASTMGSDEPWLGGAGAYLRFAQEYPRLYEMMFSTPRLKNGGIDDEPVYEEGFQPLLDRVREFLSEQGVAEDDVDSEAETQATLYWVALHGMASLVVTNHVCDDLDVDQLLRDLLRRVAPAARSEP